MLDRARAMGVGRAWPGSLVTARQFAVLLIISVLLLAYDASDGDNFNGDIDDFLRALQVRALFNHGRWYDLSIPGLTSPEGFISAWSRLVDLPYLLIARGLAPFTGEQPALDWAFKVWPPILLIGVLWLYATIQARMVMGMRPWVGGLSVALGAFAVLEFAPGRIDHHNMQMLLLMTVVAGLTLQSMAGGAVASVASVLSLAAGLETAPLLAACYGLVVILWGLRAKGSRELLLGLGVSTAAATPIVVILLIGPGAFITYQSDSLSAPHIYALTGFGVIATACCLPILSAWSTGMRLLGMFLPGLLLLGGLVLLFPTILSGPFQMIDPHLRAVWLDRILQERSILTIFQYPSILLISASTAFLVVMMLVVARVADDFRNGHDIPWVAFVMAASSFLCMLYAVRYLRFAALFVPLMLPYALMWLNERKSRRVLLSPATFAIILAPFFIAMLMMQWITPAKRPSDTAFHILRDGCSRADFTPLQTLQPGKILTGPELGIHIVHHAPAGITISSIPFQRATKGIRRTLDLFMTNAAQTTPAQLSDFDYVAVCRPGSLISPADGSLYQALASSGQVSGLQLLTKGELQIYRVAR